MSAEPNQPEGRGALIERIGRSWNELQREVGDLDDRRLSAPGPEGWSVKDHLAHLARWEQYLLAVLEGRPEPLAAFGLEAGQERDAETINAALQPRDSGLTPAEVRRLLADTHASVLARLEALEDAELERSLGLIEGNTCGHIDEHRPWIGAVVAALR